MPRILFITHTPPWPTNNGGQQRSNLLWQALRRCGDVDLLLLPRSLAGHPADLIDRLRSEFSLVAYVEPRPRGSQGAWRWIRVVSPKWVDRFAKVFGNVRADYVADIEIRAKLDSLLSSRKYDLIVGRYLQPTAQSGAMDYRPLILDVDDVDTDRAETQLRTAGQSPLARILVRRRLRSLQRFVPTLLKVPERLWVCSESDRSTVGKERSTVLPNIPFPIDPCIDEADHPIERNNKRLLFVGSLTFDVNVRGLDAFLRNAWPDIRADHPQATLRVVGSGLDSRHRALWERIPGVELAGRVDNLVDEYLACAFAVVPLFEGGGTKIKVLESLVYQRTCVVTRHAQRGFEHVLKNMESLLVVDDEAALAKGCDTLLTDLSLRDRLASTGCIKVGEYFTFGRFSQIVSSTVQEVLDKRPAGVRSRSREDTDDS